MHCLTCVRKIAQHRTVLIVQKDACLVKIWERHRQVVVLQHLYGNQSAHGCKLRNTLVNVDNRQSLLHQLYQRYFWWQKCQPCLSLGLEGSTLLDGAQQRTLCAARLVMPTNATVKQFIASLLNLGG
jgi:hypothetical protein